MLRAARHSERRRRKLCVSRNQINPEGGRVDGQACLHRHADIRRVTDSEQLCCELPA